jgi:hemerythrin superfamily protein
MSIFDKVVAAVTPPESDDARREARQKAQAAATAGDWLSLVLQHHRQIESAFDAVRSATEPSIRAAAMKRLGVILTGHSNAEESVLYPALVRADEKGHATMAYNEQAAAKTQMGELEFIDPMSEDYLDKLEHIRGAVAHHMYEEEGTWFLELKEKAAADDQLKLTQRFKEEFDRYVGTDASLAGTPSWQDDRRLGNTG